MSEFVEIRLGGTFLLNAGILGFIKVLEHFGLRENSDYFFEGQTLKVPQKFFEDNDLTEMYVKTMTEKFEPDTRFFQTLNRQNRTEMLNSLQEPTTEEQKELKNIYEEFTAMVTKASFKTGYAIISEFDDVEKIDEDLINDFKKEQDPVEKYRLYSILCDLLSQRKVKEVLIFKELAYSKMEMFFESQSFSLISRMNAKKDVRKVYEKDFAKPLVESFDKSKKKNKRCIECREMVYSTRATSFMLDTTDDISRKVSYYWNFNPDALICPLCSFLYTLVPLGFAFLGQDAVFVNNNNSIETLKSFMTLIESKTDSDETARVRIFKAFTEVKADVLENRLDNIQVVFKRNKRYDNSDHFVMNIINKDIVSGIIKGKKPLSFLERKLVKTADGYINVYEEVFQNIIYNRNQYKLIDKLLRLEFADGRNINYLKYILDVQDCFSGGKRMKNDMDIVNWAFNEGRKMRESLTFDIKSNDEKDVDNHLRSYVYKLLNYVSVNNVNGYIDTVIRIYEGKSIPSIFKEMRQSDDMFKTIGQSYILGLKYQRSSKPNEENAKEATQ